MGDTQRLINGAGQWCNVMTFGAKLGGVGASIFSGSGGKVPLSSWICWRVEVSLPMPIVEGFRAKSLYSNGYYVPGGTKGRVLVPCLQDLRVQTNSKCHCHFICTSCVFRCVICCVLDKDFERPQKALFDRIATADLSSVVWLSKLCNSAEAG